MLSRLQKLRAKIGALELAYYTLLSKATADEVTIYKVKPHRVKSYVKKGYTARRVPKV